MPKNKREDDRKKQDRRGNREGARVFMPALCYVSFRRRHIVAGIALRRRRLHEAENDARSGGVK